VEQGRGNYYGNQFTASHYRQGISGIGLELVYISTMPLSMELVDIMFPVRLLDFWTQRDVGAIGTYGKCDGSSQVDGNTSGQTGWPCRDQIGQGTDTSLWSDNTSFPAPAQTLEPAYVWNVRMTGH